MADDTSAIEDAIVEANSNGGTIFFPAGGVQGHQTIDLTSAPTSSWTFEGGLRGPIDLIQFHPSAVVVYRRRVDLTTVAVFSADTGGYSTPGRTSSFAGKHRVSLLKTRDHDGSTTSGFSRESRRPPPTPRSDRERFWAWYRDVLRCSRRARRNHP